MCYIIWICLDVLLTFNDWFEKRIRTLFIKHQHDITHITSQTNDGLTAFSPACVVSLRRVWFTQYDFRYFITQTADYLNSDRHTALCTIDTGTEMQTSCPHTHSGQERKEINFCGQSQQHKTPTKYQYWYIFRHCFTFSTIEPFPDRDQMLLYHKNIHNESINSNFTSYKTGLSAMFHMINMLSSKIMMMI